MGVVGIVGIKEDVYNVGVVEIVRVHRPCSAGGRVGEVGMGGIVEAIHIGVVGIVGIVEAVHIVGDVEIVGLLVAQAV